MVDIFGVISDPSRRKILELLSEKESTNSDATVELNVSGLVELTELTQPSVSKQLKVLRESGLVSSRSEGQQRFYSIEPTALKEVTAWVENLLPAPAEPVAAAASSGAATSGAAMSGAALSGDAMREAVDAGDSMLGDHHNENEPLQPLLPEWPESVLGLVRDVGEVFSNLQGQAVRTFDFVGDQVDKVKKTGRRLRP